MGKSYENFVPTGSVLVTGVELDPANLRVTTTLHSCGTATTMQGSRTDQLKGGESVITETEGIGMIEEPFHARD